MAGLRLVTLADRPDLMPFIEHLNGVCWPPFFGGSTHVNDDLLRMFRVWADRQLLLLDADGTPLGVANTFTLPWDGVPAHLPAGWNDALLQTVAAAERPGTGPPNCLFGCSVMVDPGQRGRGLARPLLEGLLDLAARVSPRGLAVPLRPTRKAEFPCVPFEAYLEWRTVGDEPFDPWLRLHRRAGAAVACVAPVSMHMRGTLAQWRQWTGLPLARTGPHAVPGALVPVRVDVEGDWVEYREPNVWVLHRR